jgi:hypothetical protein
VDAAPIRLCPAESQEVVLGYDARVAAPEPWSSERRARYLLRTDVEWPFSTDRMVWPSVIEGGGGPLNLFATPDALDRQLHAAGDPARVRIAITLDPTALSPEARGTWEPRLPTPLSHPETAWRNLGYDVADLALTSGLSNAGYDPTDVDRLRATWGRELNAHHLFTSCLAAARFAPVTDKRVAEHAPFFSYGLYLIDRAAD